MLARLKIQQSFTRLRIRKCFYLWVRGWFLLHCLGWRRGCRAASWTRMKETRPSTWTARVLSLSVGREKKTTDNTTWWEVRSTVWGGKSHWWVKVTKLSMTYWGGRRRSRVVFVWRWMELDKGKSVSDVLQSAQKKKKKKSLWFKSWWVPHFTQQQTLFWLSICRCSRHAARWSKHSSS